jgi:hypothetical protein
MGFGSVMVGVGTLMAIGGANPRVFHASNLLSGYIGNAPVAFFGLVNAGWSIFIFRRAHRHQKAASLILKNEAEVWGLLKQRTARIQRHSAILVAIGVVAGGASLVTAEHWEGYPILIPCIILSFYCNYIFRKSIGYDRALLLEVPSISLDSLVAELKYIQSIIHILQTTEGEAMANEVFPDPESLSSILNFLHTYDLFEDFCTCLLADKSLATAIFGPLDPEMAVNPSLLLQIPELFPKMARLAERTVEEIGKEKFIYRQRWLLEVLGAWCCFSSDGDGEKL